MTNANSTEKTTRNLPHATEKASDAAPMVVTRLSGWIGSNEAKTFKAAWIVPTRLS